MKTDKTRKRLAEKMKEKGMSMKEVSIALGRNSGFMSEFLKGKQKRLRDSDVQNLSKMLGLSKLHILGLDDEETVVVEPATGLQQASFQSIESVGGIEEIVATISHLDILSGSCGLVDGKKGVIVDPAFAVRGNVYETAFFGREPLKMMVKRAVSDDRATHYRILHAQRA